MARNWSSGDIVTATNLGLIERGVNAVSSIYEPTTWENGDVFTAEKLNNIEQGIENASHLWTVLTEESVTTTAQGSYNLGNLSYSQEINADTITVTFDGTEYECNLINLDGDNGYGGWNISTGEIDFSNYPFALISEFNATTSDGTTLFTATAGTHTVKIKAPQSGGSSDFSTAQVTVISNASSEAVCHMARVEEALPPFAPHAQTQGSSPITNGQTLVFTAILYKGYCSLRVTGANAISGTGDVTVTGKTAEVTGDCTITISEPAAK